MKKENFSKAMNEMFGVGAGSSPESQPAATEDPAAYAPEPAYSEPEYTPPMDDEAVDAVLTEEAADTLRVDIEPPARDIFAAAADSYTAAPSFVRPSPQTTILAPGTTFVGNMTCRGDVDMDCDFQGDIESSGTVTLRTRLAGDLKATVVELVSCEVDGEIHANESLRVDGKSKVMGNVYTKELLCAGTIQGNIQASGHVTVGGSSYIEGDVMASSISIESGAGINGQLQVQPKAAQ